MEKKSDIAGYMLEKNILLNNVAILQNKLADLLVTDAARYEIDASMVSVIDLAGLQLLIVFANEAEKNNAVIVWKYPSDVFRKSVYLTGLDKCIKLL